MENIHQALLCIYNSTSRYYDDIPHPGGFDGYQKYKYDRFKLLSRFPFLCKAGLLVFNNEKNRYLQEINYPTFHTGQKMKYYTFSFYPNGYVYDQLGEYHYPFCQITRLNTGLFYIPDFVDYQENQVIFYNKKSYRKFDTYQYMKPTEVILYNKCSYYYYMNDGLYIYEVNSHILIVYDDVYDDTNDNGWKILKKIPSKYNNLKEFTTAMKDIEKFNHFH
jgi:hypothetical protein